MRYGNNVKIKTTRKVYDNAGNEWDVHGTMVLDTLPENGWEYGSDESRYIYHAKVCDMLARLEVVYGMKYNRSRISGRCRL